MISYQLQHDTFYRFIDISIKNKDVVWYLLFKTTCSLCLCMAVAWGVTVSHSYFYKYQKCHFSCHLTVCNYAGANIKVEDKLLNPYEILNEFPE